MTRNDVVIAEQISEAQRDDAVAVLGRVVTTVDPFRFSPSTACVARVVAMGAFHPRREEYPAIIAAEDSHTAFLANLHADGTLYAAHIWRTSETYPFEALKADPDWDALGQSVLWSPAGTWAVVVSNEGHGIVAGRAATVATIEHEMPARAESLAEIVANLTSATPGQTDAELFDMFARLYGVDTARDAFATAAKLE